MLQYSMISDCSSRVNDAIQFSARELEILRALAQASSNKEIAAILGCGTQTVHTHLNNIYRKLDLHSRTQVAHWACQQGLGLVRKPRIGTGTSQEIHFSPREVQILRLLAGANSSDQEIAALLGCRTVTVHTHLNNIYRKLDLHSRTQVAHWVCQHRELLTKPPGSAEKGDASTT